MAKKTGGQKTASSVKSLGLVVKAGSLEAIKLGCAVAAWAQLHGLKVYADSRASRKVKPAKIVASERLRDYADVVVVLGGDGTMLYAARLVRGKNIPILGVNMGGLGFLTAITVSEVFPLLERVINGACEIEERMMLSVELRRKGRLVSEHKVLNDAVIKGRSARLVRMETCINKEYVTTYRADGLIIATPTGSTAYSLSAAGPILYPTIHSIIVAPICPFNLTKRPVVIPDWMSVDVRLAAAESGTVLVLDGQVDVAIGDGDLVSVKRASTSVYLVKYEGKSYFEILRERLMWEVKPDAKSVTDRDLK